MSETSDGEMGRRPQGRVGTVINGKWKVDARIGSGGMATVYAATHRNGHRAALKMLHTTLSRDADTRARFLREGYVANAVGHPGVVTVLDDDIAEDGAAYLVLELLEGETAEARRVRLGGRLPIDEALDIADQALDALAAAHAKGIVHRDVKPDNVFLTTRGRVKLLDFGLARMKDAAGEATRTGVTIGTPEFMPPEQAIGKRGHVDARSDVWGLGATLFTIITGEYVHDAPTLREQLLASATRRARPIRPLAPHVPPAVALVIDRALELEKHERWPSAREMQRAFRAARPERPRGFEADSLTMPASSRPDASSPDRPMAMGGRVAAPSSEPTVLREGRFDTTEPSAESPRTAVMPALSAARAGGHASAEQPQAFAQTVSMAPLPPGPRTPRTGPSYGGGLPSSAQLRAPAGPTQPPSLPAPAPPRGPGAPPSTYSLPSRPPSRRPAVWRVVVVALVVVVASAAWLLFRRVAVHAP